MDCRCPGRCGVLSVAGVPRPVAYIAQVLPAGPGKMRLIAARHSVTMHEVQEAIVLTEVSASAWDFDPDRGWRLLVTGTTYAGRELLVVLFPIDESEGIWRLGTAMPAG